MNGVKGKEASACQKHFKYFIFFIFIFFNLFVLQFFVVNQEYKAIEELENL
jgi:hypothetical protein